MEDKPQKSEVPLKRSPGSVGMVIVGGITIIIGSLLLFSIPSLLIGIVLVVLGVLAYKDYMSKKMAFGTLAFILGIIEYEAFGIGTLGLFSPLLGSVLATGGGMMTIVAEKSRTVKIIAILVLAAILFGLYYYHQAQVSNQYYQVFTQPCFQQSKEFNDFICKNASLSNSDVLTFTLINNMSTNVYNAIVSVVPYSVWPHKEDVSSPYLWELNNAAYSKPTTVLAAGQSATLSITLSKAMLLNETLPTDISATNKTQFTGRMYINYSNTPGGVQNYNNVYLGVSRFGEQIGVVNAKIP